MSAAVSGRDDSGPSRRLHEEPGWAVMRRNLEFMGCKGKDDEDDSVLVLNPPPLASFLAVSRSVLPSPSLLQAFGFIDSFDDVGLVLFSVTQGGADGKHLFVSDICKRSVVPIPAVPTSLPLRPSSARMAVIADPHRGGADFVVAQLHAAEHQLLLYSSYRKKWRVMDIPAAASFSSKGDDVSKMRPDIAMSYAGRLAFVDLARGLLIVDPFVDGTAARYVPLPDLGDGADSDADSDAAPEQIGRLRLVMPCSGTLVCALLREVADSPTVTVWTLIDPAVDGVQPWLPRHNVPLSDITAAASDGSAWLASGELPTLGAVHPNDHAVMCFFLGASLVEVDLVKREVLKSELFFLSGMGNTAHTSLYVWAWTPPQAAPQLGIQVQPRSRISKAMKYMKIACNWARQNPDKVLHVAGKIVEHGGIVFLGVPMSAALGKGIQEFGKSVVPSKKWIRSVRQEAKLEDSTVEIFHLRTVKSKLEAKTILDDWKSSGRPMKNYRVVFADNLSSSTVSHLRCIFVEEGARDLILHSSLDSVELDDSEEMDDSEWLEGYLYVAG